MLNYTAEEAPCPSSRPRKLLRAEPRRIPSSRWYVLADHGCDYSALLCYVILAATLSIVDEPNRELKNRELQN
jgi:hypothetical protein